MGIVDRFDFDFTYSKNIIDILPSITVYTGTCSLCTIFSWLCWSFEVRYDDTEYEIGETWNYELKIDGRDDEQH